MMMAHDSTPNRPALSAEAIASLESALAAYLADGRRTTALEPALHRIAAEARERDIRAEHLLLSLKDVWFRLPQIRALGDSEEQHELLRNVVTLCIREYYAS